MNRLKRAAIFGEKKTRWRPLDDSFGVALTFNLFSFLSTTCVAMYRV